MFCYLKLYIMFIYICRKNTLKENIMEYIKKKQQKKRKEIFGEFLLSKKIAGGCNFSWKQQSKNPFK